MATELQKVQAQNWLIYTLIKSTSLRYLENLV